MSCCVCERERKRGRESQRESERERKREREMREGARARISSSCSAWILRRFWLQVLAARVILDVRFSEMFVFAIS